jgi:hypothetical protein
MYFHRKRVLTTRGYVLTLHHLVMIKNAHILLTFYISKSHGKNIKISDKQIPIESNNQYKKLPLILLIV